MKVFLVEDSLPIRERLVEMIEALGGVSMSCIFRMPPDFCATLALK